MDVFGLSADDLDSHARFAAKNELNFPLIADIDRTLIDALGAYGEQEFDGKKYLGIFRTTLLIGPGGSVEQLWERVKFKGHAEEVLHAAQALAKDTAGSSARQT